MRRIAAAVPVVAVLLLTACARQPDSDPAPGVSPNAARPPGTAEPQPTPRALFGSWTLAEVNEDAGTTVTIEHHHLSIPRACGALTGSWRADVSGLFVGHVDGSSGCRLPTEPAPGWLVQAVAFRYDGVDRLLVAPDGSVTARLHPAAAPKPSPITEHQQREYLLPAALPRDLAPAGREALIGRWLPASRGAVRAYLELEADGRWSGSDGCNGQGGRWVAGADGSLLSAGGPSTLIYCNGVPIGAWMADARRAGLQGGSLILLDVDGKEIGRLHH